MTINPRHRPGPWITDTIVDNDRLTRAAPALYAALHAYFTDFPRFHKMASDALALVDGDDHGRRACEATEEETR